MSSPFKLAFSATLAGLILLSGTSTDPFRAAYARSPVAKSHTLFDGRVLDGKTSLPGPSLADTPTVEDEVRLRAQEPYLKKFAGTGKIQQGSKDFEMRAGLPGSFTRPGAAQKAFLYRLGLSSGLVVVENGAVVGHYNGVAGEYAHYTNAHVVDVNADGLSDFILSRNVEDSQAIEAYIFEMTPQGPRFSGETPVFQSNERGGDEKPAKVESDGYVASVRPGSPPQYQRDCYHRSGVGKWVARATEQRLVLENRQPAGFEPKLINLTASANPNQGKIQVALDKLTSYSDVGSSINFAAPRNEGQRIVAADPTLRLMELLDTRAAVYARENATKEKSDHHKPVIDALSLQGLTKAEQVRRAYIEHTNASLGGMSPYSSAP